MSSKEAIPNRWQTVYSGIYRDGAKIKTCRDGESVELVIRRDFDSDEASYVLTTDQAIEMAYGLLKAIKQNGEDDG